MVNPSGEIEDEVVYREQETDSSYARLPNGTGDLEIAEATYNSENGKMITGLFNNEENSLNISVSPNPSKGSFNLTVNGSTEGEKITIYDLVGNVVYKETVGENTGIDSSSWLTGLYTVRVRNSIIKVSVNAS